ncbi:MAG: hypothetical protein IKU13_01325 [Clostridia bacterium]|nr:hypothetical protein [Clostridia bacterium]
MKKPRLKTYIFMALCCTMGLFVKKIINPFANIITDSLHIPGGISTAFSTVFIVVAVELVGVRWSGSLMGLVQGGLALAMGRVGSMGALMPIGYFVPGLVTDLARMILLKTNCTQTERVVFMNMAASVSAALTANTLVFHLKGIVLLLYLSVSAISGFAFGLMGAELVRRVKKVIR